MNKSPANEELLPKLTDIIVEALMVSPHTVTREAQLFKDLNAESIDIVDIRFRIEDTFGFKINQSAMMRSLGENLSSAELDARFTVGFLVDYIRNRLADTGASP